MTGSRLEILEPQVRMLQMSLQISNNPGFSASKIRLFERRGARLANIRN